MTLRDFHSPYYIAVGGDLSTAARAGEIGDRAAVGVAAGGRSASRRFALAALELYGGTRSASDARYSRARARSRSVRTCPKRSRRWQVTMPDEPAVAVLACGSRIARARAASQLHDVRGGGCAAHEQRLAEGAECARRSVAAARVSSSHWSRKGWTVLDGLKVNGTGAGYVEYRIPWPAGVTRAEWSRGRSRRGVGEAAEREGPRHDRGGGGDYMRGGGLHDPSATATRIR
jgi:hypothetical protein